MYPAEPDPSHQSNEDPTDSADWTVADSDAHHQTVPERKQYDDDRQEAMPRHNGWLNPPFALQQRSEFPDRSHGKEKKHGQRPQACLPTDTVVQIEP